MDVHKSVEVLQLKKIYLSNFSITSQTKQKYSYENKIAKTRNRFNQFEINRKCPLCQEQDELPHFLIECPALQDARKRHMELIVKSLKEDERMPEPSRLLLLSPSRLIWQAIPRGTSCDQAPQPICDTP